MNTDGVERCPMLLHNIFLSSTASNWGSYIDDLDAEVKGLVSISLDI